MIRFNGKLVTQLTREELIDLVVAIVQQYEATEDIMTKEYEFGTTTNSN